MLIKNILSYEEFHEYMNKYNNIIVNISASWCKPCMAIKPLMEKYINVIENNEFIYLKIDHSIYETDNDFDMFFGMKKIPFFVFIENKEIKESIVSGDFPIVSQKIFDYIKKIKNEQNMFEENNDF